MYGSMFLLFKYFGEFFAKSVFLEGGGYGTLAHKINNSINISRTILKFYENKISQAFICKQKLSKALFTFY